MSTQPYQVQNLPRAAGRGLIQNRSRVVSRFLIGNHSRAVSQALIHNRSWGMIRRLWRMAVCAVSAVAAMLTVGLLSTAGAQAATSAPHTLPGSWTTLTLKNGWTNTIYGTARPAVRNISGIVHLKGAIWTIGTNPVPFTLPVGFRPAHEVYVPVDLCDAANGRLNIAPSGVVSVEAEGAWSDAQCFTSLDGVSFATSASSFTPLKLENGWTNSPWGTASPAVRNISGIVHLKGAIATKGTNQVPFTLPVGFRPAHEVYVPVDLCDATNGRLLIWPSGNVGVEAEGGTWSNAQCLTSLDGAWFATSGSSFTLLTLQNGWASYGFGPAVRDISGIVHLEGAINTASTNPVAFTLPAGFRPAHNVYVPVDLCEATNGRLIITPSGVVSVQAEGAWGHAQCFTSLDGASFAR